MIDERVYAFISAISTRIGTGRKAADAIILGTNLASWLRYVRFLRLIQARYDSMQTQLQRIGSNPDDPDAFAHVSGIVEVMQCESESAHVFAKILLDRMAETFAYYFGVSWTGRGSSHAKMTRLFGKIARDKALVVAADFASMPRSLEKAIVDYRNEKIEHVSDPRFIKYIAWSTSDSEIRSTHILPAGAGEIHEREKTPGEVRALVERYIDEFVAFLEANAERSVFIAAAALGSTAPPK